MDKPDFSIDVLHLGDCNTGKTSIIQKYFNKMLKTEYKPTLGMNFITKRLMIESLSVDLNLVMIN
jgi:GTPase SAR1 family protein